MPKVIIAPDSGWQEESYYHVEASFYDYDMIKGYVLYIDKLNSKNTPKSGCFLNTELDIDDAIYIRALKKLTCQKDIDNVPRKYKIVKDYYPF